MNHAIWNKPQYLFSWRGFCLWISTHHNCGPHTMITQPILHKELIILLHNTTAENHFSSRGCCFSSICIIVFVPVTRWQPRQWYQLLHWDFFENPLPSLQLPGNHVAVGRSATYSQLCRCCLGLKAFSQIRVESVFLADTRSVSEGLILLLKDKSRHQISVLVQEPWLSWTDGWWGVFIYWVFSLIH